MDKFNDTTYGSGNTDIYVHHTSLKSIDGCNYHNLMVGQQVEFQIGTDGRGRIRAEQVVPVHELLGNKQMTPMIPKEEKEQHVYFAE